MNKELEHDAVCLQLVDHVLSVSADDMSDEEREQLRYDLAEKIERAIERWLVSKSLKLGPTGKYPEGTLSPGDEGALRLGVTHDSNGNTIVNFGTELSWFGMPQPQALKFGQLILKHAGAKKVEIEL
jgi:hypothetical protein